MRPLLLSLALASGLWAQAPLISLIRQPKATLAEFTVPFTEFDAKRDGNSLKVHVGAGLGLRRWDDADTAVRLIVDANAQINEVFLGVAAITEVPSGESAFIGPRLRVGWAFHPHMIASLEGEHLERPFGKGFEPRRRSSLGVALTFRF
jgi:hypothetical protein